MKKPHSILIVIADADLRNRVFDFMAAAGYRVDAVFDRHHTLRRLSKDVYSVVVTDQGTLTPGDTDLPVIELPASTTTIPQQLALDVAAAIASEPL